jgi:transcriptional regulator with XRE-family HTH domain
MLAKGGTARTSKSKVSKATTAVEQTLAPDIAELLGSNIRALRDQRRWSQSELGEKLGVGQTNVSQDENGHANMTLERAGRYALALGVPVMVLFVEAHSRHLMPLLAALLDPDPLTRVFAISQYQTTLLPRELALAAQRNAVVAGALQQAKDHYLAVM